MDLVPPVDNAHSYSMQVQNESMQRMMTMLQTISEHHFEMLEPAMLTPEYREQLCNEAESALRTGDFVRAKDAIMRINLVDMGIAQTYADMDAGVKNKFDRALMASRLSGKPVSRPFLMCAADRYQRIIDRMDLEGQGSSPALVEYLNIYATILELLGDKVHSNRVHDRIPTVMLAMLEQQKHQATRFCLAEKSYWDEQIAYAESQTVLVRENIEMLKKAARFYERNEAVLCAITHDSDAISERIQFLQSTINSGCRAA